MIKIKVNRDVGAYKAGQTVDVPVDNAGTPLNVFWRRRLKDAKTDGCCEIVADAPTEQRPIKHKNRGGNDE